jgi:hypothetical protein
LLLAAWHVAEQASLSTLQPAPASLSSRHLRVPHLAAILPAAWQLCSTYLAAACRGRCLGEVPRPAANTAVLTPECSIAHFPRQHAMSRVHCHEGIRAREWTTVPGPNVAVLQYCSARMDRCAPGPTAAVLQCCSARVSRCDPSAALLQYCSARMDRCAPGPSAAALQHCGERMDPCGLGPGAVVRLSSPAPPAARTPTAGGPHCTASWQLPAVHNSVAAEWWCCGSSGQPLTLCTQHTSPASSAPGLHA